MDVLRAYQHEQKIQAGEYERQKLAMIQKEQSLAEGKDVELVDDDLNQSCCQIYYKREAVAYSVSTVFH